MKYSDLPDPKFLSVDEIAAAHDVVNRFLGLCGTDDENRLVLIEPTPAQVPRYIDVMLNASRAAVALMQHMSATQGEGPGGHQQTQQIADRVFHAMTCNTDMCPARVADAYGHQVVDLIIAANGVQRSRLAASYPVEVQLVQIAELSRDGLEYIGRVARTGITE